MSTIKYPNGLFKTTSKKQDQKLTELWMLFNPTNSSTNFDQKTGDVIYTLRLFDNDNTWIDKIFEVNRQGKILSVSTMTEKIHTL